MKMGLILNEKRKISTPRAPKFRRAKTSWKKATKILVPQKGFRSKKVSVVYMDIAALMVGKMKKVGKMLKMDLFHRGRKLASCQF